MSFLTSLSCEVSQSELFCCNLLDLSSKQIFQSVFNFHSFGKALCSAASNNCYDLRESIADTPKHSIINEFCTLRSEASKTAREEIKNPRIFFVWKVFDCFVFEVKKLLRYFDPSFTAEPRIQLKFCSFEWSRRNADDGSANFQFHRKSCRIDEVKTEMRVDGDVIEKARRNKFLSLLIN